MSVAFAFDSFEPSASPAMIRQDLSPFPRRNPALLSCRKDIWKVADFLDVQSIVGKDRAETLLCSYVTHLARASLSVRAAALDATQMRETVHDLKSMSGQLGFEALQSFCDDVLTSADATPLDTLIEPLLALIQVSTEAAESFRSRTAAIADEHGRMI
jgi:HPt (histidine-containing phosphotransfer) domain-containing protein